MSDFLEHMVHQIMDTLGYVGIALLMFLECIFPPIPSELIVPLAGFTTARGDYSFLWVCVAATLGSAVGAVVLYYIGKLVGGERLLGWSDRYGKWLGVSAKDIKKVMQWFDKHGNAVVFFCRFVPGIRSLISIPAGMASMNMFSFLLYTIIGSAIWIIALAYVGRLLGDNYDLVDQYIGPIGTVILVLVALALIGWVVLRIVRHRRSLRLVELGAQEQSQELHPLAGQQVSRQSQFQPMREHNLRR